MSAARLLIWTHTCLTFIGLAWAIVIVQPWLSLSLAVLWTINISIYRKTGG